MEVPVADEGKKLVKIEEFTVASITELPASSSVLDSISPVIGRFRVNNGVPELRFDGEFESDLVSQFDLHNTQLFKLSPVQSVCIQEASERNKVKTYSRGIIIQFRNEEESRAFHCAFDQWKKEVGFQGSHLPNGTMSALQNKFDSKIEASSAKMYFHYYGQLLHQQNMLQDYVRTA